MIELRFCRLARQHHKQSIRSFAHVFHYKNKICVTPEFFELPQTFQLGILLHEVGHLAWINNRHTEQDADTMGFQLSGVRIYRKTYRGAKNLEWIRPADRRKAIDFLEQVEPMS